MNWCKSAYLTIRKKFIKSYITENQLISNPEGLKELESLKAELEQSKQVCKKLKETNHVLEKKIEKMNGEFTAITEKQKKALDEKHDEIKIFKEVVKNLNNEKSQVCEEHNQKIKITKKKDKEIYNLETKVENLNDNVKNLKENIKGLKNEKSKLEKSLKNSEKKSLALRENHPVETPKFKNNNLPASVISSGETSPTSSTNTKPFSLAFKSTSLLKNPLDSTTSTSTEHQASLTNSAKDNPKHLLASSNPEESPTSSNRTNVTVSQAKLDSILEDVNNNEKLTAQEKSFLVAFKNILDEDLVSPKQ